MSSSRQPHTGGGSGTGPGTSSSASAGSTSNAANGSNSGNGVNSRTMIAGGEGLPVSTIPFQSPRGNNLTPLSGRPSSSSGASSSISVKRRRSETYLCNGLMNSYEDMSNDFVW